MPDQSIYTVALAGSTERTALAAHGLIRDPRFKLTWVLTPAPKIIGKNTEPTVNPVHRLAQEERAGLFLIKKSLREVEANLRQDSRPDFLLVVDFGYLLPDWSLQLPKISAANIHPSALPKWRGSSPGQFSLLYGEKNSAITIMVPTAELDAGPIIHSLPFTVEPTWTQTEYYAHSFDLASRALPELLLELAAGRRVPHPQPSDTPTPIARRLTREDGFVEWSTIQAAMSGATQDAQLNPLLLEAQSAHGSLAQLLEAASRALRPWPGLWTTITTKKGSQRMKLLDLSINKDDPSTLEIKTVQIEGKKAAAWSDVKDYAAGL